MRRSSGFRETKLRDVAAGTLLLLAAAAPLPGAGNAGPGGSAGPAAAGAPAELQPLPDDMPPPGGDIPRRVVPNRLGYEYDRRDVMIPMRDGVKLHTVIVVPHGAHGLPILLTRTPYNATKRALRGDEDSESPFLAGTLPQGDDAFADGTYIRVFQDVRGKYGSEGEYVMTRPPIGPLNRSNTDDTTDAWDTIEWLTHNLPEGNGRVGMLGSSYEGWTVVMALLHPHPALKVASPESPMVDGWMGDDWFHYGAFRQNSLDYFTGQMSARGGSLPVPRPGYDDYETFLRAGSAGAYATANGLDQYPWWHRTEVHPAYDAFWQDQALDRLVAAHPSGVPTLWEQGLWDQEDMWGAVHSWLALRGTTQAGNNHLILGPWRHSQVNYDGGHLGVLDWHADTAFDYRHEVLRPFFDQFLRPGAPHVGVPAALIYDTGDKRWDRFARWPVACDKGCDAPLVPIFLGRHGTLSFTAPDAAGGADSYVSDPAKPVPYLPRPVAFGDKDRWKPWLTSDQRPFADRPDVLVFETDPLTAPVRISGRPEADLWSTTTGTDGDWVVKLIDVFPADMPEQPEMAGYQLPIGMDIFRGRYRDSFEHPSPIPSNQPQRYRFALPPANHVFQRGHRIMVQVQSSWFPLYDRNPQRFVPNIFLARPADYIPATVSVLHDAAHPSAIRLPVVPAAQERAIETAGPATGIAPTTAAGAAAP
ncbi:CocE/NonD family hydrolase [Rhizosaccharibacter radicis]|uniref:CocE/NonD family hydrolase n=1 Tax=Rhizosaccharibacter radicis TaxID=2782605 RepID=A0ABT1W1W5_9PROT|nr:CocE/NonD family hydrolase [Acetobacteraceae bacterium KSS12]